MEKQVDCKEKLAMRWKSKWNKFMKRQRKLKLGEEMKLHNNIENSVSDKYIRLCKVKI